MAYHVNSFQILAMSISSSLNKYFLAAVFQTATLLGLAQAVDQNEPFQSGNQLFDEGKYAEAIAKYEQASEWYQSKHSPEGYVLSNLKIAEAQIRLGKLNEGLELGQNTLSYLESNKLQDNNILAEAYSVIGDAYLNMGRNDQALEFLQKSLEQYQLTGKKRTPELAACYNDLGVVYWNNGNNNLALQYHKNALDIRKSLSDKPNSEIADSYNNIGLAHSDTDFQEATTHFELALGIYQKLLGSTHPKVALCYNNLALVSDREGDFDQALVYLVNVLQIWNATFDGEHPNKAFTYASIGRVNYHQKEYGQAILNLEKALKSYHLLYGDKHPEVANTFNQIGGVHLAMGNFEESIEYFQDGIYANLYDQEKADIYTNPELKNYYNADILLYSLQQKSKAFETLHYNKTLKLRDLKASLSCLELADQLVSRIRKIRLNEKDKLTLSAKAAEIYDAGVQLAFAMSELTIKPNVYREKAFDFAERSRSSTLLSAIQDTNAKQFSGIPSGLLEKETQLKNDIAFFERKLAENSGEDQEKIIRARLLQLNNDYNGFIKDLENQYPKYYNLKFNEGQIKLADLQQSLDDETAFITHFITDQRVYCFYITNGRFRIFNVPKVEKFDNYVSGLRNSIKYDSKEHFLKATTELYAQLFPMRLPGGIKNLIIVPEGVLATIPFEVLVPPLPKNAPSDYEQLPYLIKDYSISYDNSATLFAQRKKEIDNYKGETEDILLVAPVNFRDEYYANMTSNLSDLPGSENEINEIKYLFKSKEHDTMVLTDAQATEINLKSQELHKYKYLHFATHGVVDESRPELSRIFLRPTYNDIEDGSLYSGEIYNINIHADLVCLSACQTGLGKLSRGEGIIGLSRALLYAGAENLVVSLWTVSDNSTSKLMIDFYNNHLYSSSFNTFSGALRKAKLKLIAEPEFSRPYYWAPFILIGE